MNVQNETIKVSMSDILDKIVSSTFARHAGLTEDEYLNQLEVKNPKSEDEEVRNLRMALICACTREVLKINDKITLINQTIGLIREGEDKDNGINN